MNQLKGGFDAADAIAECAGTFGMALDSGTLDRLEGFTKLFLHWNRSINLTALRSDDELVGRHLIDAFALAALAGSSPRSAVDVGSGGGLPAIPLAVVMASTAFVLFEPNRKKAAFLRTAIRELDLGARARVETVAVEVPVGGELRGRFDLALSRATLAPAAWLEVGRELVRPGGQVAVFAAGRSDEGLPPAEASRSYGEGRRLLLFRA